MEKQEERLELYKLAVGSALDLSTQKQSRNRLYLAMITALVAVTGIAGKLGNGVLLLVMTAAFGMAAVLCSNWMKHLATYRDLVRTKFEIIQEMEKDLEYAFFTKESEIATSKNRPFLTTELEIRLATTLKWVFVGLFAISFLLLLFHS